MSADLQSDPLGHCRWCGAEVAADSFRDLESLREYQIGASCQGCQDAMYLGVGDEDPPVSHPVRHGVIVGAVSADEGLREVALVPFLFVVPSRRLVWETRYIVRAGISPQPVDPWLELDAMRHAWSEFNVRVLCVPSSENPLLRGGLIDRDLVIGLDEASVRVAAELCPGARPPALVSLGAELPWRDAYGSSLLPLTPFLRAHAVDVQVGGAGGAITASALRQCALAARLLALPATTGRDAGRTAFELLLVAHAARFAESWRGEVHDGD